MSEAQTILNLIENVDPEDSDTLDEIDARVWLFLKSPIRLFRGTEFVNGYYIKTDSGKVGPMPIGSFRYTRSRDALKAIRPEGWGYCTSKQDYNNDSSTSAWTGKYGQTDQGLPSVHLEAQNLPTEELAELHAIIQAIEWERKSDNIDKAD